MTMATITIPNMIKITQIIFQRQLALCLRSGGQQQGGRARRELELQCVTTIALVRWSRSTSATTLNKFSLYLNPSNYWRCSCNIEYAHVIINVLPAQGKQPPAWPALLAASHQPRHPGSTPQVASHHDYNDTSRSRIIMQWCLWKHYWDSENSSCKVIMKSMSVWMMSYFWERPYVRNQILKNVRKINRKL